MQGAGTPEDDQKQMFGLFWTLGNFAAALDPRTHDKAPLGAPRRLGAGCAFRAFRTRAYKLHFFESPTGIRLVLNTSPDAGDLQDVLAYIYETLYVGLVARNPLYTPGQPFQSEAFSAGLAAYLRNRGMLPATA